MKSRYNISLDDRTHKKAKEDAAKLGLSMSAYISYLVNREK